MTPNETEVEPESEAPASARRATRRGRQVGAEPSTATQEPTKSGKQPVKTLHENGIVSLDY